jgi:hypothetical protein
LHALEMGVCKASFSSSLSCEYEHHDVTAWCDRAQSVGQVKRVKCRRSVSGCSLVVSRQAAAAGLCIFSSVSWRVVQIATAVAMSDSHYGADV